MDLAGEELRQRLGKGQLLHGKEAGQDGGNARKGAGSRRSSLAQAADRTHDALYSEFGGPARHMSMSARRKKGQKGGGAGREVGGARGEGGEQRKTDGSGGEGDEAAKPKGSHFLADGAGVAMGGAAEGDHSTSEVSALAEKKGTQRQVQRQQILQESQLVTCLCCFPLFFSAPNSLLVDTSITAS